MPSTEPQPPLYDRFAVPVVLVTEESGREVFKSAKLFFRRLDRPATIRQLSRSTDRLSADSVLALNTFLKNKGLECFRRKMRREYITARILRTKYALNSLLEDIGARWEGMK